MGFGGKKVITPCPNIRIASEKNLYLNDAEIRLLCGDKENSREGKAWSEIPLAQAKTLFKNFLQDRGYYHPTFKEITPGLVEFDAGPLTQIKKLSGKTLPSSVRVERFRTPMNEPLTPQQISSTQDWLKRRLQEEGYPCPEVRTQAFPEEGEIQVEWMNPRPVAKIEKIHEDAPSDLNLGVVRRFDAFKVGGPYSLRLTDITSRRNAQTRLVLSQDFEPRCDALTTSSDNLQFSETVRVGPPRLIAIGIGANTETGPLIRGSWAHTRLGRTGSSAELMFRASFREQRIISKANWFYTDQPSRTKISPLLQFSHENEPRFELLAFRSQALWETGTEVDEGQWRMGIGPAWQNLQQLRGIGPVNSQYFSLKTELEHETHLFEYYARSPRTGYRFTLASTYSVQPIAGAGNPWLFQLEGNWLEHLGGYDPPLVVWGARSQVFYTLLPENTLAQDVPVDFRRWIGGGRDIRGFSRGELPDHDGGTRMGVGFQTEVRVPFFSIWKIEPLLLADYATILSGLSTRDEKWRSFWSPGFGLRYESPIGTIRTTLAHGFEIGNPLSPLSHIQFYLSLGEEF